MSKVPQPCPRCCQKTVGWFDIAGGQDALEEIRCLRCKTRWTGVDRGAILRAFRRECDPTSFVTNVVLKTLATDQAGGWPRCVGRRHCGLAALHLASDTARPRNIVGEVAVFLCLRGKCGFRAEVKLEGLEEKDRALLVGLGAPAVIREGGFFTRDGRRRVMSEAGDWH